MAILEKKAVGGITEKTTQPAGSRVFYVGAAWDGDVDLDLAAVPIRRGVADENLVLYYGALSILDGALVHSGDALDGSADGDDESMVIKIDDLPDDIEAIAIGVFAYNVPDMSAASNTRLRICDGPDASSPELYSMPMTDDDQDGETLLVACVLTRIENGFVVKNISDFRTDFAHGAESLRGFVKSAASYAA